MSTDAILAGLQQIGGIKPSATVQPSAPDYHAMAIDAANRNNVPVNLMLAQTQQESAFNPNAVSPQGAVGISQFTPATAKQWGVDPNDPASALDGQARLMRHYLDVTNGDQRTALKMYYGGPNQSGWGAKTNAYPDQVFSHMQGGGDPASAGGGGASAPAPANDPILQGLLALSSGGDQASNRPSGIPNSGNPAVPAGMAYGNPASPSSPGSPNSGAGVGGVAGNVPGGPVPASGPDNSNRSGFSLSGLTSTAASADPFLDSVVNGNNYGSNLRDALGGDLEGALRTGPETVSTLLANGLDKLGILPGAANSFRKSADTIKGWENSLSTNPDTLNSRAHNFLGSVLPTLPLSELTPISGLTKSEGLAAALARYGDMSLQGGVAGAAMSGGKDVGSNAMWGAALAPVAGAAVEKVIAPAILKSASAASNSKIAQALRDFVPGGSDAATSAASTVDPADIAAFRKAYPEMSGMSDQEFAQAIQRSRQGGDATPAAAQTIAKAVDLPQGRPGKMVVDVTPADSPDIPPEALGSRGARTGIEAHDQMPADVAATYADLTKQGVAPDEALREADIRSVGAQPTASMVTRNPAMMAAEKEGAKSESAAGQALNLQQAEANAALHNTTQGMVQDLGGAPAPGEAMQTAAQNLQNASQAERQQVSDLYQQADAESKGRQGDDQARYASEKSAYDDIKAELESRFKAMKINEAVARKAGAPPILDLPPAPELPAAPVLRQSPGYIDLSGVRAQLNTPEMANPTIDGVKSLRSGALGLMDAYKAPNDLYTAQQAESIRQAIGAAYDPMGGSINHQVGSLKSAVDTAMDNADGGELYKQARAAHKAWAAQYENPQGVAKLIRTDAQGNLVNDDSWRTAENMIGAKNDKPFVQIVAQLQKNGDQASLNKLKASIVQDAYQTATGSRAGTAGDQLGNSVFQGSQFHNRLNQIGMNKLKALFTPPEIAKLASIGRAGVAINEAVPGTVNTSGTASKVIDAISRMNGKKSGIVSKGARAVQVVGTGASLVHNIMTGNIMGGLEEAGGAGFAGHMLHGAAERAEMAKALKEYSTGLKILSSPQATRAADQAHAKALADALLRRAAAREVADRAAPVAAGAVNERRR